MYPSIDAATDFRSPPAFGGSAASRVRPVRRPAATTAMTANDASDLLMNGFSENKRRDAPTASTGGEAFRSSSPTYPRQRSPAPGPVASAAGGIGKAIAY